MRKKLLHIKRSGNHGYMYMAAPDAPPIEILPGGEPGTNVLFQPVTDLPTPRDPYTPPVKPTQPVIAAPVQNTDPLNQDFYAMTCDQLQATIANIQNILMSARLTADAKKYYDGKLAEAKTAYTVNCGSGSSSTSSTNSTTGTTTSVLPGTTVNIGDTSSLNPSAASGAGGGGGGGGDSSSDKKAPKKKNWWLLIIAVGALALALYEGRNSTIKMAA